MAQTLNPGIEPGHVEPQLFEQRLCEQQLSSPRTPYRFVGSGERLAQDPAGLALAGGANVSDCDLSRTA